MRVKGWVIGIAVTAVVLAGCGGKAEEVGSGPAAGGGTANSKTSNTPARAADATSGCPSPACSEVLADVEAGANTKTVPGDLVQSLQDASKDFLRPDPEGRECASLPMAGLLPEQQPCIWSEGKPPTAPLIFVIGDSNAKLWGRPVQIIAKQLGYRFGLAYHTGCRMPDLTFPPGPEGFTDEHCREWKKEALDWISQQKPTAIVVASAHPRTDLYTDAEYAAGYAATLKAAQAPDRKLFVMSSVPVMYQDPLRCLSAHLNDALKCATPVSDAAPEHELQATSDGAKQGGASFVNITPWACTSTTCPAIIGKYPAYYNNSHLTTTYGEHLAPVLLQTLGLPPAA